MPAFDFVLAGRYRLTAPLGEGGMATVYRARDLRLNRDVAIKVLHDDLTRDPGFLSRFEREAQIVASLSHPNIVPVHDVGEEGGSHFIVMEYIRGHTLREMIESRGSMPPNSAIGILRPVLEALGYAHRQGLIHRDVKPHNILLSQDGTPRLADFGIAHLVDGSTTRTAAILGSAHYLSPEQSRGEDATIRSDIYSCGIVLYEIISGHPPFDGNNALAVANQHLHAVAAPLSTATSDVSPALDAAIRRALAKDPDERYEDTAAFIEALEAETMAPTTNVQPIQSLAVQSEEEPLASPPLRAPLPRQHDDTLIVRRSPRKAYLLTGAIAACVVAAAYLATLPIMRHTVPPYPPTAYAVWAMALCAGFLISWVRARHWVYSVDDDVAVVQWGVLGHHRFGLPIRNVATLQLKQSPIDRLLGVGTVELCARDEHGHERQLVLEDLPHPRQTYEDLMRLLGRALRSRAEE